MSASKLPTPAAPATLGFGLPVAMVIGSVLGSGIFACRRTWRQAPVLARSRSAGRSAAWACWCWGGWSRRWLLQHGTGVVAAGGGGDGVAVARAAHGQSLRGVAGVVEKDLWRALLAREIDADCLLIATDVMRCTPNGLNPVSRRWAW